jgi:ADP-heptose:LPS heptosyltransferase
MRIIVNRSDAIGDTILTTPMAQKIKEHFPDAHITFIISPRIGNLLKGHSYIDDTWVLDEKLNLKKKFKEYNPTHYFYIGGSQKPSITAVMTGVPFRGGLKSRWPTFFLLNRGVRQKRSQIKMHEVEYNLELLTPLGINQGKNNPPVLNLLPEEIENGLAETGLKDKEYIVVHPGMSGHTLNWPSENYGKLIEKLEEKYLDRFTFVFSFTPSDAPYLKGAREYLSKTRVEPLFLDGAKLGLRSYMGVLKNASLFIGPSTGPTHIANSLGTKVIGIYSPIKAQSALRWGPFVVDERVTRVVTPKVDCGETVKCAGDACPYYECMRSIEVNELVKEVQDLL